MPDEPFAAALAAWLAPRLGAEAVELVDVRRRTEGFSWETYTATARWVAADGAARVRGVAVRREPDDGLLGPYDAAGQYRLHETLLRTDVPVPALVGLELDGTVLGRPFYAMDRVEGVVPVQWHGSASVIFPDDDARRRVGLDFVDRLAEIHTVDWRSAALDALLPGPGEGDAATAEIDRWERFLDDSVTVEVPMLRAALSWCRRNAATSGSTVLCHGDYRIGNFMVRDGRIVAVFDWELAHLGDPVEDIAWASLRLFRGRSPLVSQLLPADEFTNRYTERTGLAVAGDVLRFWTVLGMVKAAVPHVRAATIFERGRSADLRLAAMGHQCLHVLRQLGAELGWISADRAGRRR
jgi:aminoglycoside phosphotransferase (APT) family kinase protein